MSGKNGSDDGMETLNMHSRDKSNLCLETLKIGLMIV